MGIGSQFHYKESRDFGETPPPLALSRLCNRHHRRNLHATVFLLAGAPITLIASAYNLAPDALWFPPLIETLIAISILYMTLENIVGGSTLRRRWVTAFGFGLVHGFGFSFVLRDTMQFAGPIC